jgi:hypothetical protein
MADQNSRYNLKLSIKCEVEAISADGKGTKPFADTDATIKYNGMNYLQIVVTQDLVAKFGKMIAETGFAAAAMSGFEKEIAQLKALQTK